MGMGARSGIHLEFKLSAGPAERSVSMSEPEPTIKRDTGYFIPTRSKSKIAHTLSWPVGAGEISSVMASVGQFSELVLHFREGFREDISRRQGIYRLIGVTYVANPLRINSDPTDGVPLFNRWELIVGPVPRTLRHKLHELILSSALPQIRDWLDERSNLNLSGSDHLRFFYREQGEQFYSEGDQRLEPVRTK